MSRTATHKPATRKRKFRHDELTAVDAFSGFGGLTLAVKNAGFTAITAANHNQYKVEVHEANHPEVEHWIADLANPESSDYHSAADLPAADLFTAGVTCTNHTQANTQRAYLEGANLFDLDDPEFESRRTRSEKDRATAMCVLQYAAAHHPKVMLIECTTEIQSWGDAVPGKSKVGDGTTYKWWLRQIQALGYKHKILFLNSMFFGVGQSRDRWFGVFWDEKLPTPDLDHQPHTWCDHCSTVVEARWTWRTGVPATGSVRYGKQYDYRCPRCRRPVVPPFTPSLDALDLSNLGTRIGDREKPLAAATMARAERCRQKFSDFPAVVMPAKAAHGSERSPLQPLSTQTSQQEAAILSTGDAAALAIYNFQGAPRGAHESLPAQGGSETLGIVSSGVLPFRRNTVPTSHAEPMPTVTAEQIPGILTAAGRIQMNGSIDQAQYRSHPLTKPLGTIVGSAVTQGLLFSGWFKQNGSTGTETAAHPVTDPFGTLTSRDTTAMLNAPWQSHLKDISLEDCYFRMMMAHEVGRGCGFDVDWAGRKGSFIVWGSARKQVDGYGNAVSPAVGQWISERLRDVLQREMVA